VNQIISHYKSEFYVYRKKETTFLYLSVCLTHQKPTFLFREDDTADQDNLHSDGFSPEAVDSSNTFGDDMLQMALKMATGELDEPAVDLEAALTPNTITATQAPPQTESSMDNDSALSYHSSK